MGHHSHQVGNEQAQSDDEHRRSLHVEVAQSVEPRQRQPGPEQRNTQRARTENLPEPMTDVAANRARDGNRKQSETDKEAQHQSGEGAQPSAGIRTHTGTAASVTRRSW